METNNKIKDVVIVGGGTAGWTTAALLSKILGKSLNITLIESDQIGIVGVGEATIPPMLTFNAALGIEEKEFLKETNGTIKLGIQFENWKKRGESYMHAFGGIGKNFPFCDFSHFWVKDQQENHHTSFWDFSLNYQAAKQGKFAKVSKIDGTNLPGINYAYHFDASLYAKYLRKRSESMGVKRIEGIINNVELCSESGYVKSLSLTNENIIKGDLFIDCSGARALLIEEKLNTGFEDWSHWLPCNRAVAVASESVDKIPPYTRSIAHDSGWQWKIPLQHRVGNGLVYSTKYMTDEEAKDMLLANIDGSPISEPKVIPFRTGMRRKQWNKNVVCIGLSSGFLEPLESTSIHLIQSAVIRLIKSFPHKGVKEEEVNEYNRQSKFEYEKIRDFIILHYKVNQRDDSGFWRECQRMEIPDSLAHKIELFKTSGKVFRDVDELFTEVAWQQVMIGQGIVPEDYHPLVNSLSAEQIEDLMESLKTLIQRTVDKMPTHEQFISSL